MTDFDVLAATADAFRHFKDHGPHAFLPDGKLNAGAIKRCSLPELEAWRDREIALVEQGTAVVTSLRGLTGAQGTEASARLEHRLGKECDARCQFIGYLLDTIHMLKEDAVIRNIHEKASARLLMAKRAKAITRKSEACCSAEADMYDDEPTLEHAGLPPLPKGENTRLLQADVELPLYEAVKVEMANRSISTRVVITWCLEIFLMECRRDAAKIKERK